jgi:hypothetical protein
MAVRASATTSLSITESPRAAQDQVGPCYPQAREVGDNPAKPLLIGAWNDVSATCQRRSCIFAPIFAFESRQRVGATDGKTDHRTRQVPLTIGVLYEADA